MSVEQSSLINAASYNVGDIRVTTIADGLRRMPLPEAFVINASKTEVSAALAEEGLPREEIVIHFNPIVIDTAGKRVLLDTGMGAAAGQAPDATNGLLMKSLAVANIDPQSIDVVVISHFHGDHINGLVALDGTPAFPNAKILVPAPECNYWMDDKAMAAATPGRVADLFAANRKVFGAVDGQVTQYDWGDEVVPGVTAEGTPGHTPGHTSFLITSRDEKLFVQSDVTNHPALFVTHPGWHAGFDQDGALAETTRRRILGRMAAERIMVQGFHFPFPSRGLIEKTETGFRLVPTA
jgi:glyoxylase-like metal-dependent hydrolase (beta-lactamase superfamily II)